MNQKSICVPSSEYGHFHPTSIGGIGTEFLLFGRGGQYMARLSVIRDKSLNQVLKEILDLLSTKYPIY